MSRLSMHGAGASCGARACPQLVAEEPAFCQLGPQARVGGARAGAAAAAAKHLVKVKVKSPVGPHVW